MKGTSVERGMDGFSPCGMVGYLSAMTSWSKYFRETRAHHKKEKHMHLWLCTMSLCPMQRCPVSKTICSMVCVLLVSKCASRSKRILLWANKCHLISVRICTRRRRGHMSAQTLGSKHAHSHTPHLWWWSRNPPGLRIPDSVTDTTHSDLGRQLRLQEWFERHVCVWLCVSWAKRFPPSVQSISSQALVDVNPETQGFYQDSWKEQFIFRHFFHLINHSNNNMCRRAGANLLCAPPGRFLGDPDLDVKSDASSMFGFCPGSPPKWTIPEICLWGQPRGRFWSDA